MAAPFHFLAGVLVVVDFASLVGQRLVAGLDVDDAEASHGHTDVAVDEESFIIRAAVGDLSVHGCQCGAIDAARPVLIEDSTDAAHLSIPPMSLAGKGAGKRHVGPRGSLTQGLVKDDLVFRWRYDPRRVAMGNQLAVWNYAAGRDHALPAGFNIAAIVKIQVAKAVRFDTIVNKLGITGPTGMHPGSSGLAEEKSVLFLPHIVDIAANFGGVNFI